MGEETRDGINGWTVHTLKVHLVAVMDERDKRYAQRFEAQESASKYAQEKANEFRGQLKDQAERFMPRTEGEQASRTNSEKIDALATRAERLEGALVAISGEKSGREASFKLFVVVVGLIVSFLVIAGILLSVVFAVKR
jgi:tetrahydromethanopterin S-methyltransferase subunit G